MEVLNTGNTSTIERSIVTQKKTVETKELPKQIIANAKITDTSAVNVKSTPSNVKTNIDIVDGNKEINTPYHKLINPTTGDKKESSNADIYYINGIMTKSSSAEAQALEIANLSGKPINLLYNPTQGMLKDVVEAALQVMHIDNKKSTVDDTAQKFYETLKGGKELKIVAHSQGTSITAQALTKVEKRLLFENENPQVVKDLLKKVVVTTIGGASSKEDYPKDVTLFEVKHKNDIVPKLAEKTGTKRPEDLLYKIKGVKDKEVESLLWNEYQQRADQRALGKIQVALQGAVACSVTVACEYVSLKTDITPTPKVGNAKTAGDSKISIIDLINKNHDALPNTDFKTGYLVNKDDRSVIAKALG